MDFDNFHMLLIFNINYFKDLYFSGNILLYFIFNLEECNIEEYFKLEAITNHHNFENFYHIKYEV